MGISQGDSRYFDMTKPNETESQETNYRKEKLKYTGQFRQEF